MQLESPSAPGIGTRPGLGGLLPFSKRSGLFSVSSYSPSCTCCVSRGGRTETPSPESPRWLVAQGRIEDAHTVLARVNARGDKENPVVVSEFARIIDALQTDQAVAAKAMSPRELIRTPVARRRLAIGASPGLFSCIAGNIIASYYISTFLTGAGITNPQDQLKAVSHIT